MKKLIILFITGILTLALVGCSFGSIGEAFKGNSSESNEEAGKGNENLDEDKAQEEGVKLTSIEDKPIVTIEDLPVDVTILKPDSIGTRYMEATYKNNSDYIIKGFNITILLEDSNEKTYLATYDEVLPGDTSCKFETLAPKTGKPEDYQCLAYEITAVKENGEVIHITYDVDSKEYTWF